VENKEMKEKKNKIKSNALFPKNSYRDFWEKFFNPFRHGFCYNKQILCQKKKKEKMVTGRK